jgi:hypothetical protein
MEILWVAANLEKDFLIAVLIYFHPQLLSLRNSNRRLVSICSTENSRQSPHLKPPFKEFGCQFSVHQIEMGALGARPSRAS